jgi:hypothetical protein
MENIFSIDTGIVHELHFVCIHPTNLNYAIYLNENKDPFKLYIPNIYEKYYHTERDAIDRLITRANDKVEFLNKIYNDKIK